MYGVDHRRLTRHGQRLSDGAHLQHLIELDRSPNLDADSFLPNGGESGEREGHRVLPDRQVLHAVRAVVVRDDDGRPHASWAAGFHRDSNQHAACVIAHDAAYAARRHLRKCRVCPEGHGADNHTGRDCSAQPGTMSRRHPAPPGSVTGPNHADESELKSRSTYAVGARESSDLRRVAIEAVEPQLARTS